MVLYWLAWAAVRLLATGLFRLRVSGAHHVPKTGGGLIAPNHASYLDIPILGCGVARRGWFIGRVDLFSRPAGWVVRHMGWMPIPGERVGRTGLEGARPRPQTRQGGGVYPGR